jgi:Zn-dependent M28 family amino/carboxypeptidase
MMEDYGFDNVHLEPVMVPHWVRGEIEECSIIDGSGRLTAFLSICALGGSIGTPIDGVLGEVIEVRSFDELDAPGLKADGKIVFFNRPFDPAKLNTFEAYGEAVEQRSRGAIEAAKEGAVAVLVRSMTLAHDDVPHTGAMGYDPEVPKIPAAAISTYGADSLSKLLQSGQTISVRLKLSCETLEDVLSHNVVGEIRGAEKPYEVIVVGGHLDSWDKGTGAHDDGAGCVQALEAVRLIKDLGLRPKRTIRAVMFMNEENGVRGGRAYPVAKERAGEKHIAAVESDRGGFAPRGISVQADSTVLPRVMQWEPLFEMLNAGRIEAGYSGVDIFPLVEKGVPGFGLDVENHRYFDYHHSSNDTMDKVHPRELELGAIVEALLCYLISEEGL